MGAFRGITYLVFSIVISLLLTVFAIVIHGILGSHIYHQYQARNYPTTTGVVTSSEISPVTHPEGYTSYEAKITFNYEVGGVTHVGDRYRYSMITTSDYIRSIVNRYPAGAEVRVHYNPAKPSDAVVEVDINPLDLLMLYPLAAVSVAMLGSWAVAGGAVIRRITHPAAGGAPVFVRSTRTRVRLPRMSPLPAAFITALGLLPISPTLIVLLGGIQPPLWVIGTMWAAVLISVVIIYLWLTHITRSGAKDLVIDEARGMLTLPHTYGRKTDVTVPVEAVGNLSIETRKYSFMSLALYRTYAPKLAWKDEADSQKEDWLAEWRDPQGAEDFVFWLNKHLGRHSG